MGTGLEPLTFGIKVDLWVNPGIKVKVTLEVSPHPIYDHLSKPPKNKHIQSERNSTIYHKKSEAMIKNTAIWFWSFVWKITFLTSNVNRTIPGTKPLVRVHFSHRQKWINMWKKVQKPFHFIIFWRFQMNFCSFRKYIAFKFYKKRITLIKAT